MEFMSQEEWTDHYVIVAYVLLALHVLLLPFGAIVDRCREACSRITQALRSCFHTGSAQDPVLRDYMANEVSNRRPRYQQRCLWFLNLVFLVNAMTALRNSLTGAPRLPTQLQDVTLAVMYATSLISVRCAPFIKSPRAANFVAYMVYVLYWVGYVVLACSTPHWISFGFVVSAPLWILSVAMSACMLDVIVVCACSCLSAGVMVYAIWSSSPETPMHTLFSVFLFIAVTNILAALICQRVMVSNCWHQLKENQERIEADAAKGLLTLVSDAVVKLDPDLRIIGGSARLAALLLFNGERGVQQRKIQDLMSEACRVRFLQQLAQNGLGSITVTMHDGWTNPVQMTLQFIRFLGRDQRPRHLVAVQSSLDGQEPSCAAANGGGDGLAALVRDNFAEFDLNVPQGSDEKIVVDVHREPTLAAPHGAFIGAPAEQMAAQQQGFTHESIRPSDALFDMSSLRGCAASSGGAGSDASSSSGGCSRRGQGTAADLVKREAEYTREKTMQTSLLWVLRKWKTQTSKPNACCFFHDVLADLRLMIMDMQRRDCKRQYKQCADWKCKSCGLLADGEQRPPGCILCPGTLRRLPRRTDAEQPQASRSDWRLSCASVELEHFCHCWRLIGEPERGG
eukprot:TRINITY_DN7153_c0_g1_i8.p1 TRINITY_DN7153_c0_g1~~TRINITY_DN7153_c0_g1_i8.p1  ORF type:complete len:661 (+),score=31.06 TRINITY_DN7153_c0_g1_i8:110-1984(+)